jgi:hypothetical protein
MEKRSTGAGGGSVAGFEPIERRNFDGDPVRAYPRPGAGLPTEPDAP